MGKEFAGGGGFADVLRLRVLAEYALTDAETDVALRMLRGEKNWQIADGRGAAVDTVRDQVRSVLRAARVADRVELSAAVLARVGAMLKDRTDRESETMDPFAE